MYAMQVSGRGAQDRWQEQRRSGDDHRAHFDIGAHIVDRRCGPLHEHQRRDCENEEENACSCVVVALDRDRPYHREPQKMDRAPGRSQAGPAPQRRSPSLPEKQANRAWHRQIFPRSDGSRHTAEAEVPCGTRAKIPGQCAQHHAHSDRSGGKQTLEPNHGRPLRAGRANTSGLQFTRQCKAGVFIEQDADVLESAQPSVDHCSRSVVLK